MTTTFRYIGRGVYSTKDAERLTGIPSKRIRRWTRGYRYLYEGKPRFLPAIIAAESEGQGRAPVLSFADLIEVRFLEAFLDRGVPWRNIRRAAEHARVLLGVARPFSSHLFMTDGRTILAKISDDLGDPRLIDLANNQYEFEKVVSPMLWAGLEFDGIEPQRWWPMGTDRGVVLDPARAFGAPIVAREGVPTEILARAVAAEGSERAVARWYEVSLESVVDAVAFERSLPK